MAAAFTAEATIPDAVPWPGTDTMIRHLSFAASTFVYLSGVSFGQRQVAIVPSEVGATAPLYISPPVSNPLLPGIRYYPVAVRPFENVAGVKGAPYSAEHVIGTVRILTGGWRATRWQQPELLYRDAEGRTRTERPLSLESPPYAPSPMVVEIRDPVAGLAYILNTEKKIAYRIRLTQPSNAADRRSRQAPPLRKPSVQTSKFENPDGAAVKVEYLGRKKLQGVNVIGLRTTTTNRGSDNGTGSQTIVDEAWVTPYFDLPVYSHSTSGSGNESISKLVNISLKKPDPALFKPPEGWTVVDDDDFTVTISYTPKLMPGILQM